MIRPLTRRTLLIAVRELANADPALAASVERFGPPPLWAREPSYATLVHLILEQQVSLASARAAFDRLDVALAGDIEPSGVPRAVGRRAPCDRVQPPEGGLRERPGRRSRGRVRPRGIGATFRTTRSASSLMRLRGIGRWTADIYLIMCLRRPDVWPHGDQALATAARELLELPAQPTFDALELRARSWRPHRATAARILWHHYLSVRGRA